jgi:hypothetical protein
MLGSMRILFGVVRVVNENDVSGPLATTTPKSAGFAPGMARGA